MTRTMMRQNTSKSLLVSLAMALETDSLNKRTLGPAIGSAVVGIALGVITIIGIAQFSGTDTVPEGNAVSASDAVLGGPEYGSRN